MAANVVTHKPIVAYTFFVERYFLLLTCFVILHIMKVSNKEGTQNMLLTIGVINLVKLNTRIRRQERKMRERGEQILDDVRQQRLKTVKWDSYVLY